MDGAEIAKALDELTKAKAEFADAEQKYKRASRDKTNAINRLNKAQAAFDVAAAAIRADAPWDSDWHRRNHRGVEYDG